MKRVAAAALLVSAFAGAPALAQSPFDGTWKEDLSTYKAPEKPDVFAVRNGIYTCETCVPRVEVPADKADHAVTGHPYFDQIAVRIVDDRTIRFARRLKGKLMFVGESRVSPDGKLLTYAFKDTGNPNGQVVTGHGTMRRVGPGPAGAHAISGAWRDDKVEHISDAGLIVTLRTTGDVVHMSTPTGQSYDAKLSGPPVPVQGDPGHTMAAVKRLSANVLQETDTRDGKVVGVWTVTVEPGGRVADCTWDDRIHGTMSSYKARKQ